MLYDNIDMKIRGQKNEDILKIQRRMAREVTIGHQETLSVRPEEQLLGRACLSWLPENLGQAARILRHAGEFGNSVVTSGFKTGWFEWR